jgi:hypothetical protein
MHAQDLLATVPFNVIVTEIPEPAPGVLLAAGLAAVSIWSSLRQERVFTQLAPETTGILSKAWRSDAYGYFSVENLYIVAL